MIDALRCSSDRTHFVSARSRCGTREVSMLESEVDKNAFTKAYQTIVAAYGTHLPPAAKENPAPSLLPEQFEACWAAECHRQFWRPQHIRRVLIAESHVYTDSDD